MNKLVFIQVGATYNEIGDLRISTVNIAIMR